MHLIVIGGLIVSMLAIKPKFRELKPGLRTMDFKVDKNPQHAFLRRGSKAVGQM
jgi:hypothetical protein